MGTLIRRHRKHRASKSAGVQQYLYDGQQLLALLELRDDDRWWVIIGGHNVGSCATRAGAVRLVEEIESRESEGRRP
jgi:hypothetical protein